MSSTISIEIVPHIATFLRQTEFVLQHIPAATEINIPDLSRIPMRSWEACEHLHKSRCRVIPHLRACDFSQENTTNLIMQLRKLRLQKVLIVSGDPPSSFTQQTFSTTIFDLLEWLKEDMPTLQVYAAFDPYRGNIDSELVYAERKLKSGFSGLFTQPFFSLHLLRFYQEILDSHVYWGLSPVITSASRNYWERRNKVNFPKDFTATIDWNLGFGKDFLEEMRRCNTNCYIMPIQVQLEAYLTPLFCNHK